uniref:Tripartite motif-containing protein 45 n=1 Tax=Magallana gigas TaxID=29159 RepID=A0A8W8MKB6_MAGGI|nr:E3 ubiquitin/ISG15 ligase TRIM25-like [Crassostrea gigas]
MAESKQEDLPRTDDKFRCPICLEEVRNPKYLPCYHTFCKSCIQTYISSTVACRGDNSPDTIQCPVCRKSIQAPSDDASSEEWACSLPEDKLILSMSIDSDQSENQYCMFCQRNNKTVQAKHWCKTCTAIICDDCKFVHSYVPILESHRIVSLSDVEDLKTNIEIDEPCLVHMGKYVEVFCQDHDQLCCTICFATKHRTCKTVESIDGVSLEKDESSNKVTPKCLKDFLKKLDALQEEYKDMLANLNTKKQEIFTHTETKVEEIKSLLDRVNNQWMKQFEQKHSDAVGHIEITSDGVKRLATTIQGANTLLQRVLENGTTRQVFITRHKIRHQILDHVNCLCDLNWDVVHNYNQPDTDFLRQILEDQNFQNVEVLEKSDTTFDTLKEFASKLNSNDILRKREIMAQKDWMSVRFEKLSESNLTTHVYYGLFIDDTKVLLSIKNPPSLQIYDITDSIARCVFTYPCSTTPFGLCYSGESMNKVFVSFVTHVDHYQIEISDSVMLKKMETFQLKRSMKAISRGSTLIFSRSDSERMICTPDFSVKHTSNCSRAGNEPFISSSFHSNHHAIIKDKEVVVVDQYNENVYKKALPTGLPRGLAFDLQDNILISMMGDKLRQIRRGGGESRDIDLPGITQSYNVVLHPTGEKVVVLDFSNKFCIYKVL